ncbi:MAG: lipocalin family protein [Pyrinomonadaceae bacterium]
MNDNLFQPIEDFASDILGGVANLLGYEARELSAPPADGQVTLPEDLFAQPFAQTEWWYYTGHCTTETGREFGFEFVFFKRRTDHDQLGPVPLRMLGNPMYFAHFAISDIDTKKFRYEHIRSLGRMLDLPVVMSEKSYDLQLAEWSIREVAGRHVLHATLNDGLIFDAVVEATKPIVLNGNGGITTKKDGASKHFSFTRMSVAGQFTEKGSIETFSGSAWMDREFGSWEQTNWDWFSIQFNDETELMLYIFQDETGAFNGESTGTFVDRDGTCTYLGEDDFDVSVRSSWVSAGTGAAYPAHWDIRVESLGIEIEVEPLIDDQELDTRGTTMIIYWEGACSVIGSRSGAPINGRAYVELVGYDRSHETMGLGDFLFGSTIRRVKEILA